MALRLRLQSLSTFYLIGKSSIISMVSLLPGIIESVPVWQGSSKTILRFIVMGTFSMVIPSFSMISSDMSDYYCIACLFIVFIICLSKTNLLINSSITKAHLLNMFKRFASICLKIIENHLLSEGNELNFLIPGKMF